MVSDDFADGDTIRLRVADNGPAIADMNVGVLTGTGEEPRYHGSGLGRWLVNWIVRRSNGTLEFEANDPRGNVVTIALPATSISTADVRLAEVDR